MKPTLMLHGQFNNLTSFALVNRHLSARLKGLGYQVIEMPSDGALSAAPPATEPDIYLAHDHPYDVLDAPGKFNVFFLEYDYARILKQDALLVERLNHFFDVLLVPSEFVRAACQHSGIQIPIVVCPLGFDPSEFHPNVPPLALPTDKKFKFLYLGGATERKGTDLLLRSYADAFRSTDNVVLVLKTFGYQHLRAEFETQLAQIQRRPNAPEIIYEQDAVDSIASYYTAADCGVFPFRGEGFGLPILEAIACGCPVLVTDGGGPRDYCSPQNAKFIAAAQITRRGKVKYAPDVSALAGLMRQAYEHGALASTQRESISRTVAAWTWLRTAEQMDAAIRKYNRPKPAVRTTKPIAVSFAYYEKGDTSWRKEARLFDRAIARHFTSASVGFDAPPLSGPTDLVFGEGGFALEHFLRAARLNPSVIRFLRRSSGPFDNMVARNNLERVRCGLPPRVYEPMEYWRNEREGALADQILLPSRAAYKLHRQAGYPADKLRVITGGIPRPKPSRPRRSRTLRFLFIGTDPFRKGVRVLFQAWDALQPRNAELVCIVNTEILQSPLLLRYLVRNPNISVKPLMSRRALRAEFVNCDCQVLPSFEDGFSIAVAEGMAYGKPAIVSRDTGISGLLTHLQDGYIVPTGSVSKLTQALAYFCSHREKILQMGAAALETAHYHSHARYYRAIVNLVQSYLTHA